MTALEIAYWYGNGTDFFSGTPGATAPRSAVAMRHTEQIEMYVKALGGNPA